MNRRRIKLAALSASMILSLGLMVSGVYAATTQGGTISNTVTFAVVHVAGSIQYKVTGDSISSNDTYASLLDFAESDTSTTSLSINELFFAPAAASGEVMTISLKINNTNTTEMYYTYTAGTLTGATNVTLDSSSSASVTKTAIAAGTSVSDLVIAYKLTSNTAYANASLDGFSLVITSA